MALGELPATVSKGLVSAVLTAARPIRSVMTVPSVGAGGLDAGELLQAASTSATRRGRLRVTVEFLMATRGLDDDGEKVGAEEVVQRRASVWRRLELSHQRG